LILGCLGIFGLTSVGLIISGLAVGTLPGWEKFFSRYFWVGVVVPLIGILISIAVAAKITQPIYAIIEQADRFSTGDRGAFRSLLRIPWTSEHDHLYQSVSSMANELKKREDEAQYFADFYLHELSNGLTKLTATLSNLRDYESSMSPEKKSRELAKVQMNAVNLNRVVDELDVWSGEWSRSKKMHDLDLSRIADSVKNYYAGENLGIQLEQTNDLVRLGTSETMLESMVISVVGNAYAHGGPHINVQVNFGTIPAQGEMLEITITDTGVGIPEEENESVFEEFFTTRRDTTGGGMGLPSVRKLLEIHGGSIDLLTNTKGAKFLIKIPVF